MTLSQVIFVGALPPPVSGQSVINSAVLDALNARTRVVPSNVAAKTLTRSISYHARRVGRAAAAIATIHLTARTAGAMYLSCDGGYGLAYNAMMILAARPHLKLFIHHHSYSYIDREHRLMRAVVNLAGSRATHIFLCDEMRKKFANRYGASESLVSSNARYVEPPASRDARQLTGAMRVGLLSNLNAEKGLYDFLDVLRLAKERGADVVGILAGPVASAIDRIAIAKAKRELGSALDVRGPVHGAAKARFYEDVDVFLFPTRYAVESYGLVVTEALANGAPVISFGRGCIPSYLTPDAGRVLEVGSNFAAEADAQLRAWSSDPVAYTRASSAALRLFSNLRSDSESQFLAMVTAIVGGC